MKVFVFIGYILIMSILIIFSPDKDKSMPKHTTVHKLSDEDFYKQLKIHTKKELNDDHKDQIEDILDDYPDPDEFKRKLIRFSNSMQEVTNVSPAEYIRAVWFVSLYAQGHTQVDAYRKIFPERVAKKREGVSTIGNSASAYFHSMLVQSIWKQVNVSDHMLFIEKRFKAYAVLEEIMDDEDSSKKEKIEAAGKLANLLKPPKEAEVRVNVGYQSKEIKALEEKLAQMADQQLLAMDGGNLSNKDIVEAELFMEDDEETEEEFDYDIHDVEVYEKYGIIVKRVD